MANYNLNELKKKVKKELHHDRYQHTLGVMYTAASLAMRYDADLEEAMVAGLLHDCAKSIPNDEKLELCSKYHLSVSKAEMENPTLLHAKVGAALAREKYGVKEDRILRAIEFHTTGCPDMTLLEKIIYIADYIEPYRNEAPNLKKVRSQAFVDIDECLFTILEDSLAYLSTSSMTVDPMTEKTYLFYKEKQKEQ